MSNTSNHKKKITSVNINSPLVWIDMEMSGLNPKHDVVLEIATIITDNDLNILAEGPNFVVHHPPSLIGRMDEWNRRHHTASGLIDRIKRSRTSLEEAENKTLEFVKKYCKEKISPLCGNSVAQDRRFLFKYMPRLEGWLHYRNIDVSSIKELIARWWPDEFSPPKKKGVHQALADIRESIEELKYYRNNFFSCLSKKDQESGDRQEEKLL